VVPEMLEITDDALALAEDDAEVLCIVSVLDVQLDKYHSPNRSSQS
jgi:hypothetical protein